MHKSKKLLGALMAFCAVASTTNAQLFKKNAPADPSIEAFDLNQVKVASPTILRVQRLAIDYMMGLDADRLVAPYLREAGLSPQADSYSNWENTGLDGHICGHYLSALAYMYAATGDARAKERLDYTVAELVRAQNAFGDGYLCGTPGGYAIWKDIILGKMRADAFSLNGKWVPLYNIHKTMAGLRDASRYANSWAAKDAFLKLCKWFFDMFSRLSDDDLQKMLRSEHGGINEIFADAYEMTGNIKYLDFSKRLTHNVILTPLLDHEDKLTGMHANTQIPKVIGIMKIASVSKNDQWRSAADYFWNNVVYKRSVSIGGNSVREHFHPTDDFSPMIASEQGPETCNTYNMLRLTKMLFLSNPSAEYMDFYERAMLNHILSSINTVQGGFVYFTPMRPGHYRVYSQPQTSMWCCVGSGLENHCRYGEMIYAHKGKEALYVNTFLASKLDWKNNGAQIEILGDFPWDEKATLVVHSAKPKAWKLKVRRPSWCDGFDVQVNDDAEAARVSEDGYVSIERTWGANDTVRISLPMRVTASPLPDGCGYYSFLYGPMVLAADMGRDRNLNIYADDSRGGHIADGPKMSLNDMPTIILDPKHSVEESVVRSDDGKNWQLKDVEPAKLGNIKLVPFVNLSEHRYEVYFRAMTADEFQVQKDQMARLEAERMALDAKTVDRVVCGEQQPETDHGFAQDASSLGSDVDGTHWRETRKWFSYTLRRQDAKTISLTYRQVTNREARIFCDGKEVGALIQGEDKMRNLEVVLPDSDSQTVTIKIEAVGQRSPRVYEVRTLK